MVAKSVRTTQSLRFLFDTARELGVDVGQCLEGSGLTPDDIQVAATPISIEQEVSVIENFIRTAPVTTGLGAMVGKRMHVNVFGIWGFAILSSPTLRSAIETAIAFIQLSLVVADMDLIEEGDRAHLRFIMDDLPPAIHQFLMERHSVVAMTFITEVTQLSDPALFTLELSGRSSGNIDELSRMTGATVAEQTGYFALSFPAELLDQPLLKSDPMTQQYCLDQCRILLEEVAGSLPPWSSKVRDVIVDHVGSELKIKDLADGLAVTERTLRRRLTEEGTSFRELYADVRMAIAYELLETAGLNIETVSWRVGYAESASFVRAFSKKYGKTPGEVRNHSPGKSHTAKT